ncbi:ATP-dependent DNA helicase [Trichonephila clavipes]|nr:ATP-dependent DNA helicase [Trichonephila clavipes]
MVESKNSDESSNAVIVQIDVHHRPCSQLNLSIATTNNVRVNEFQATSDRSSIYRSYPKTDAERTQEYRARKKAKIQSAVSTIAESINSEEFSNANIAKVYVHHHHCSQLSASIATTNNVCVNGTQPSGKSIGLPTGRPGFDARCHQIPSECTGSTCSLNQWVRSLVGLFTSAGTGEYFPPLQFTCRNSGGGDRGRVAIYHPFGEFHRA